MIDAEHIRRQFELLSRSELQESLSRPQDYTPEAYLILEQVAEAQGVEKPADDLESDSKPAWRQKLKVAELADWYLRCGMLTGLLWAQIMDRKDKDMVIEAFRAWEIDRAN